MCEIHIGNPKYTRNTLRLLSSGTKLFITFELKVFRHEERETQSFYADCFYIVSSQPNQRTAPVAHKFVWLRPALYLDSLVRRQELNSLLFLKSPKSSAHASGAWRHSYPQSYFLSRILFWNLCLTHPPCAHVCTELTHALSRKVLILTKPKGKIYKTRSPPQLYNGFGIEWALKVEMPLNKKRFVK